MPTAQLLSHDEPAVSVHLHNHPWSRYCWPITLTSWFPPRLEQCSSMCSYYYLCVVYPPSHFLAGRCVFAVRQIHTAFSDCALLCIIPYLGPLTTQVLWVSRHWATRGTILLGTIVFLLHFLFLFPFQPHPHYHLWPWPDTSRLLQPAL